MPKRLLQFLDSKNLAAHLRVSLALGLFARILSAFFVYGPQALDDYKHGVYPAYQFFAGMPLDLPDYRSHLLVWLLAGFLKLGSFVGVESALGQVRVMYFGLALLSLSGIFGTYFYARKKKFAALALYMMALYPLMPFLSTRAFGESVATGFVCLGLGLGEDARRGGGRERGRGGFAQFIFGFLALGFAVLFRFHVGLIYVSYAAILFYARAWRGVTAALVIGMVTAAAQAEIDLLSGKQIFGTLFAYLTENSGGAVAYGVSPWYNTWILFFGLALVPFSLVFWRSFKALWREEYPVLIPILLYVLAHSLVPHKEERFLYPILGVELWALSFLWYNNASDVWARRIFSPVLLGLGSVVLLIACVVNTQEGEIEPPAYAESHFGKVLYLDQESLFGESRIKYYFLRPPSVLEEVKPAGINTTAIDDGLKHHPDLNAVVLLTSRPETRDQLRALERIKTMASTCGSMRAAGSPIDRLLYKMNPRHNERRRPTWYLICERSGGG